MKKKISNFIKLVLAFLIFYYSSNVVILCLKLFGVDIDNLRRDFREFKHNWKSKVKYSLKLFLIFMLIKFGASYLSSVLALTFGIELTTSDNQNSINMLLKEVPLLMIITSVFLAPIYEEILFRLGFKKCIKNKVLFVLISGFIFGFIHVFPTDLNLGLAIFQVIPYVTMGICLAYYYQKCNNIWYSILLHFYNNLFSIIILLVAMLAS